MFIHNQTFTRVSQFKDEYYEYLFNLAWDNFPFTEESKKQVNDQFFAYIGA